MRPAAAWLGGVLKFSVKGISKCPVKRGTSLIGQKFSQWNLRNAVLGTALRMARAEQTVDFN